MLDWKQEHTLARKILAEQEQHNLTKTNITTVELTQQLAEIPSSATMDEVARVITTASERLG